MANIVITVPTESGDKKYTLEFNRRTIIKMEAHGFISQLAKNLDLDQIYELVHYACLKNHPEITNKEVEDIVDTIPLESEDGYDLKNFVEALAKLIEQSLNALKDDKRGNARWEVN